MIYDSFTTYFDENLGRPEFIFPRGTDLGGFASSLPNVEVLKNTVLDPSIMNAADGESVEGLGPWTQWLAVDRVKVAQRLAYSVGSSVGFTIQGVAPGIANLFDELPLAQIAGAIANADSKAEGINAADLVLNSVLGLFDLIGAIPNPVTMIIGALVNIGEGIADSIINSNIDKRSLPPFISSGSDSDSFQVPLVMGEIQSRDTTRLFRPRYAGEWKLLDRDDPRVGRGWALGRGFEADLKDGQFSAAGYGGMPGVQELMGVIEVRMPPPWMSQGDNYAPNILGRMRCTYEDRGCGIAKKNFQGTYEGKQYNCRQCVDIYRGRYGLGEGFKLIASDWNRPYALNTGTYYAATSAAIADLWLQMGKISPVMYTARLDTIASEWQSWIDGLIDYLGYEWEKWSGRAHRLAIAQIMSSLLIPKPNQIGEATWISATKRVLAESEMERAFAMSVVDEEAIGSKKMPGLSVADDNVIARIVMPSLEAASKRQHAGLRSTMAAYTRRDDGAFRDNPSIHDKAFADLLTSPLRYSVRINDVVDPQKRDALIASGVPALGKGVVPVGGDVKPGVYDGPSGPRSGSGTVRAGQYIGNTGALAFDDLDIPIMPGSIILGRPVNPHYDKPTKSSSSGIGTTLVTVGLLGAASVGGYAWWKSRQKSKSRRR